MQRKTAARQHIMDAATASAKSGALSKLSGKTPGRTPGKAGADAAVPQTLKFPDSSLPGATLKGVLLPSGGPQASIPGGPLYVPGGSQRHGRQGISMARSNDV